MPSIICCNKFMHCRAVVWLNDGVGNRLLVGCSKTLGRLNFPQVSVHKTSGGMLDIAAARNCIMPFAVAK